MYSAHLHLLLNHWPIIGTYIGLALLVVSLISRQDQLKQAGLVLFALIALVSIPAYMSGNSAQLFLKETPEVSVALVERHQGAALLAFVFMEFTGLFALVGVWQFSRGQDQKQSESFRPAGWNIALVLLLAIGTCLLMAITGTTGGEVRHPEIGAVPGIETRIADFGARILPVIQDFVVNSSRWIWPILEDLHFVGLILIIGTIGLLNLRIMGFFKQLPVAPIHRFIPWGVAGFFINIVTGMLFFIGMPPFYSNNPDFQLKMVAIVVAGANLLLFYCSSAFRPLAKLGPGEEAPVLAKLVAVCSLLLWISLIVLGRYMPFFEVLQ